MKERACYLAYELMRILSELSDGDFVDEILDAIASNDEMGLSELWERCQGE